MPAAAAEVMQGEEQERVLNDLVSEFEELLMEVANEEVPVETGTAPVTPPPPTFSMKDVFDFALINSNSRPAVEAVVATAVGNLESEEEEDFSIEDIMNM